MHLSDVRKEAAKELGSRPGALVGLGIDWDAGGAATATACRSSSDDDAWDVLEEIPKGSAAALLLIEPQQAVPLRDAMFKAGGCRVSDGFISPLDLIEICLLARDEMDRHALEPASWISANPPRREEGTDVWISKGRAAPVSPGRPTPLAVP